VGRWQRVDRLSAYWPFSERRAPPPKPAGSHSSAAAGATEGPDRPSLLKIGVQECRPVLEFRESRGFQVRLRGTCLAFFAASSDLGISSARSSVLVTSALYSYKTGPDTPDPRNVSRDSSITRSAVCRPDNVHSVVSYTSWYAGRPASSCGNSTVGS